MGDFYFYHDGPFVYTGDAMPCVSDDACRGVASTRTGARLLALENTLKTWAVLSSVIFFGGVNVAWCWRFVCRSKVRQARSPNHHPTAAPFVLLISLTRRITAATARVPRLLVYAKYTRFHRRSRIIGGRPCKRTRA